LWRNNNPGNIIKGVKARKLGSIGAAGGFAVFPDYETGREALKAVLLTSYPQTTLYRLVSFYAPNSENNVPRYRKMLHDFTGLSLRRKVGELSANELILVMEAIERIEGTRKGNESNLGPAKKIIDVRRDSKNRITGYEIDELGFLSPLETVNGILSGEIDGVVVERGGRTYVRTRPDQIFNNNLEEKGRQ
jgi:hypothetical protein